MQQRWRLIPPAVVRAFPPTRATGMPLVDFQTALQGPSNCRYWDEGLHTATAAVSRKVAGSAGGAGNVAVLLEASADVTL